MTKSSIRSIDKSARLIEARTTAEKRENSFTPPFRPLVAPPMKRRGPIIAGGIIRFDLGGTRSDES